MSADSPSNRVSLLIVDDDPSMVRLLTKILETSFQNELSLESVTDPEEARRRIDRGGVDILLTDLEMPGLDGLDLLRIAKGRSIATQVLFLTGKSSHHALLEALEHGASDYLLKPVRHEALVERVAEARSRRLRWQMALAATWRQQHEAAAAGA